MSRYTGPRLRILRSLDAELPGLTRKKRDERPYPPGQHGAARKRRPSEYKQQLLEKQKLRMNYGLRESQMRRLVEEAKRSKFVTGDRLLELLERRLDSVVFRAGFAPTIPAARQLVNHGHVLVNGKRVDIASYRVAVEDVISLRERSRQLKTVAESVEAPSMPAPEWLNVDANKREAKLAGAPSRETVAVDVDVQLVVEYYSR